LQTPRCLVGALKTTLDHVVEMHREYLSGMARRARNTLDQRHRDVRQRANKGLATVLRAMEIVTDETMPKESRVLNLYMQFDDATLRESIRIVRDLHELGDRGYFDELLARHSHFRRYWPAFVTLPFKGEPGTDGLLAAIELARTLNAGDRVPDDAPVAFATGAWRAALTGGRDRRLWELALAFAMRDALRSGDLYLAESRNHISFWNLVHSTDDWQNKRPDAYGALNLPTEADHAIDRLRAELDQAAHALAGGLDSNPFASLSDGRLQYSRIDGEEEPSSVRELRRVVETHLPRIRIEDLLIEVDSWCGFTRELVPLGGYQPRVDNFYAALLAALVAHGTNLGIATMAQSTQGLSVETLHHISRWYLRPETLKAANRRPRRLSPRLANRDRVGRGRSVLVGWAALRHSRTVAAGVLLSALFWLLRPRRHRLHAHLRSIQRVRVARNLVLATRSALRPRRATRKRDGVTASRALHRHARLH
jgi:hypothetical protein